jgi:glyoxalase-like protein
MDIDHVILGVESIEDAVARLSPDLGPSALCSRHPEWGSENAIWLPRLGPYIEVLAGGPLVSPGELHLAWRAADRDDLVLLVERLGAMGVEASEPAEAWGTAPKEQRRTWILSTLPRGAMGGAASLLISHHGWDWRRELAQVTAPRVARVTVESSDPLTRRTELDSAFGPLPSELEVVDGQADRVKSVKVAARGGQRVLLA